MDDFCMKYIYGDRETKSNSIAYEFADFNDLIACGGEVIKEGAVFTILPNFTRLSGQYPELKQHEAIIKEAEMLKDKKIKTDKDASRFEYIYNRLISIVGDMTSIGVAATGISLGINYGIHTAILALCGYMIIRLCRYFTDRNEFDMAVNESQKMIESIENLKYKSKDRKFKLDCDTEIKKLKNNISALGSPDKFRLI